MRRAFISSGDLIADRRYSYGLDLAAAGDHRAAVDLFEQALDRAPLWAACWLQLGRARQKAFDLTGAATAFRECLKIDSEDRLGATLELARIDAMVSVESAPRAYVASLFDAYAEDFDKALVERLDYRTPQRLATLLRELTPAPAFGRRFPRALDLGCGTGLMGEASIADIGYLEGVDLSAGMIDVARAKGVYDALRQADLLEALMDGAEAFDLILAADVLIYLGDLRPVFRAAAARLAPLGLFAFSTERTDDVDWRLGESLRFAHSADYLLRSLNAAGLELLRLDEAVLRKDRGADVAGFVIVARRPAAPDQVRELTATADVDPLHLPF